MSEIKVTVGRELSKATWLSAADNIGDVAPMIAQRLQTLNYEGQGRQDAQEFMNDILLATIALRYVAEHATDKCRFLEW